MGGSSKSSSGQKSYDYFGSLAAAVCYGPVDTLHAIICDGVAIWEGTQNRSGASVDLTSSIDPKYFTAGGFLYFYWGTSSNGFAFTGNHPDYSNVAVLRVHNFLFGREKSTAPNFEVIVSRKPVCDTSLCAGTYNILDDGHVNPVAVLAELLTSPHGLGLDVARLDASSWASAAIWCHTNRTLRFCAPLLTADTNARQAIAQILELMNAALSWTATGTLALRLLKPGEDPGGLTTLDAQYLTQKPRLVTGGWGDVPTGVIVRFADRDRKWKTADVEMDNLVARLVRGEPQRRTLDLADVIARRAQAEALATEALRQSQHPASTVELSVRREFATQRPGDKIQVDVDPEPNGSGLAQLGIVRERRDTGKGVVDLTIACDPIADATPYTPTFTPENPQDAAVASIAYAQVLPLANNSVAILAARPQDDCIGFRVYFSDNNASDFAELGTQEGYSVRMTLDTSINADDTTIRLTLTDGASGRDAYLAERTAGDTISAQTDSLLLVLANIDGNGRVSIDADGLPEMEFCSIVTRSAVDSDTHDYTVLRARKSFKSRAWTSGTAKGWIILGVDLVEFTHENMITLLNSGDPGYIRLASFTGYIEDDSSPLPEFQFAFPSAYDVAPVIAWSGVLATSPYTLASTGIVTPNATITDADGNLIRVELFSTNASGVLTSYLNLPLAPTAATTLQDALAAAGLGTSGSITIDLGTQTGADQYFTLTLAVTDNSGNRVISERSLVLPGSSGAGLGGVTYSPLGSDFVQPFNLTLTVGGTATKIEYSVLAIGSAQPSSGTIYTGTSKTIYISSSKRVWARASDGSNNSAWQKQDYVKA